MTEEALAEEVRRIKFWIRHWAAERKLTLDQLAVYAGISRSTLFGITVQSPPNLRTLSLLAAQLEIECVDLLRPLPTAQPAPEPSADDPEPA